MLHARFDEIVGHSFITAFFIEWRGCEFCVQFDGAAASASAMGFDLFQCGFSKPVPPAFFEDAESLEAGGVFRRV